MTTDLAQPPTTVTVSGADLAREAGVSFRQLDHWRATLSCLAELAGAGSGHRAVLTPDLLDQCRRALAAVALVAKATATDDGGRPAREGRRLLDTVGHAARVVPPGTMIAVYRPDAGQPRVDLVAPADVLDHARALWPVSALYVVLP